MSTVEQIQLQFSVRASSCVDLFNLTKTAHRGANVETIIVRAYFHPNVSTPTSRQVTPPILNTYRMANSDKLIPARLAKC